MKIRVDDVRKTLDILYLLNEGKEMENMMEGSHSLKQFQGRLELAMAAVMGHSFGGSTTILTLAEDSRFKSVFVYVYAHSHNWKSCGATSPLFLTFFFLYFHFLFSFLKKELIVFIIISYLLFSLFPPPPFFIFFLLLYFFLFPTYFTLLFFFWS